MGKWANAILYYGFPNLNSIIDKTIEYRVRQSGCSLTHIARTPPAVHPGTTILVVEIEIEKKKDFLGGGNLKKIRFSPKKLGEGGPPPPSPTKSWFMGGQQAECVQYG